VSIPSGLRQVVVQRAGRRCEYCLLSEEGQEATFHIDHVVPTALGGPNTIGNLALACVSCSLRKGARVAVTDLLTGREVGLYNPRTDEWSQHFRWNGVYIEPLSSVGRVTVEAMKMNRPLILAIRLEEQSLGRSP